MPTVTLRLPLGLTYPESQTALNCEAATVGAALDWLLAEQPRLRPRIFVDESRLIVGILVNGRDMRHLDGLATRLTEGDEIALLPPVIGG